MEINSNTFTMLCEIEQLIGDSCYNPNSYDGYTEEEGRSFRYPLTYDKKDNEGKSREYKTRSDLSKYNPYAIGSNQ